MAEERRHRKLARQYADVALQYLRDKSEESLYRAALLGRQLLADDVGPTEVVQFHLNVVRAALREADGASAESIVEDLGAVLLEVMMVYGESHRRVRDVLSELREQYDELDRTKQELERSRNELREKTAQLVQTGKMNALGELSVGVAHEINQPLNALKLINQDILRDAKKGRLDETYLATSLEEAVDQIRRVTDIVDQLRLYARKTTGERHEVLDVNQPIEDVLSLIGQQLTLRGITVDSALCRGVEICGDRVRLEQVVMNLIANARDAVLSNPDERGRSIALRTYVEGGADAQELAVFEIRDNGQGIPHAIHEKIFEPFFTTKPVGQGTGLGLSVSREIVAEHGGHIEVESDESAGTSFRVKLPAARR